MAARKQINLERALKRLYNRQTPLPKKVCMGTTPETPNQEKLEQFLSGEIKSSGVYEKAFDQIDISSLKTSSGVRG